MDPIRLSRFLGIFSIALGAGELLLGRRIASATGVRSPELVRTFGVRELASGAAILARPSNPTGVLSRVGGDLLDALAVGRPAIRRGDPARNGARIALDIVAGTLLIDIYATARLAGAR